MRVTLIVLLGAAFAAALPSSEVRIIGGSNASIQQYPFAGALLFSNAGNVFTQTCAGAIVNNRTFLTAALCVYRRESTSQWLTRVGSASASNGGTLYSTQQIIIHPNYDETNLDKNFALVRVAGTFSFGTTIAAVGIAGSSYTAPDNSAVWAVGWGATVSGGPRSEQLQHVQLYVVNRETCRQRYIITTLEVTANNICAGLLDVGGRDQCTGDEGSPLLHNGVLVGIGSWNSCGYGFLPSVNARISSATNWITSNA